MINERYGNLFLKYLYNQNTTVKTDMGRKKKKRKGCDGEDGGESKGDENKDDDKLLVNHLVIVALIIARLGGTPDLLFYRDHEYSRVNRAKHNVVTMEKILTRVKSNLERGCKRLRDLKKHADKSEEQTEIGKLEEKVKEQTDTVKDVKAKLDLAIARLYAAEQRMVSTTEQLERGDYPDEFRKLIKLIPAIMLPDTLKKIGLDAMLVKEERQEKPAVDGAAIEERIVLRLRSFFEGTGVTVYNNVIFAPEEPLVDGYKGEFDVVLVLGTVIIAIIEIKSAYVALYAGLTNYPMDQLYKDGYGFEFVTDGKMVQMVQKVQKAHMVQDEEILCTLSDKCRFPGLAETFPMESSAIHRETALDVLSHRISTNPTSDLLDVLKNDIDQKTGKIMNVTEDDFKLTSDIAKECYLKRTNIPLPDELGGAISYEYLSDDVIVHKEVSDPNTLINNAIRHAGYETNPFPIDLDAISTVLTRTVIFKSVLIKRMKIALDNALKKDD